MKFKAGDEILFNNGSSIFTKEIRRFNIQEYGESKCTHSGIIAEHDKDTVTVFEIVGFKGPTFETYLKKDIERAVKRKEMIVRRSKVALRNVKQNCYKYMNIKYGILDILTIKVWGIFGIKISLTSGKRVICSELSSRIQYDSSSKKLDFEKEFKRRFDLITPMDKYYSKQLFTVR